MRRSIVNTGRIPLIPSASPSSSSTRRERGSESSTFSHPKSIAGRSPLSLTRRCFLFDGIPTPKRDRIARKYNRVAVGGEERIGEERRGRENVTTI